VLKLVRVWLCAAALTSVAPYSTAQPPPAQKPAQEQKKPERAQDTFFAGNVVSVTADKLTVSRRTLALTSVTRVFLLDADTKIEGRLVPKVRVTVKFEKTDDGDRAVRVIVR
jgi:hypothetical protein